MSLTTSTCLESCYVASTNSTSPSINDLILQSSQVLQLCNKFEFGWIAAKRFPIWSLDLDLLLDFAQSGRAYEKGLVVDSEMGVCVFIPPLAHWMPLSSHELS